MKVRLGDLRNVTEKLFDHLQTEGFHEFEIDDDYYWKISSKELYDPTKDPTDLGLDRLPDNWEWLNNVLTGKSEPIAYQLVWLAAFLRWVGEKVVR